MSITTTERSITVNPPSNSPILNNLQQAPHNHNNLSQQPLIHNNLPTINGGGQRPRPVTAAFTTTVQQSFMTGTSAAANSPVGSGSRNSVTSSISSISMSSANNYGQLPTNSPPSPAMHGATKSLVTTSTNNRSSSDASKSPVRPSSGLSSGPSNAGVMSGLTHRIGSLLLPYVVTPPKPKGPSAAERKVQQMVRGSSISLLFFRIC